MIFYYNNPKKIYLSEDKVHLLEDVFVSDLTRGRKAKLSYNKRPNSNATRNIGNKNTFDMVDTGKMDQNNADTYIVPLKGGINSYNITSIKGTEVMHYFKNKFANKKTNVEFDINGKKTEFELMMEDSEFQEFLRTFTNKVSNVVNHVSNEIASRDRNFEGFKGVSIYPVPSSSNFNTNMAEILKKYNIGLNGLPCDVISSSLFKKDLSNLQKDHDFINKNKEYYDSAYYKSFSGDNRSHEDLIDDSLRKMKELYSGQDQALIDEYNMWVNRVLTSYRAKVAPKTIAKNYQRLVDVKNKIRAKIGRVHWDKVFKQIKYAKGPSIEGRTKAIQNIVASILGKTYISNQANQLEIVEIRPQDFQIKNLTNDLRMGMRNYFKPKDNIEEELKKINGTVFVIFDDNISGGATLSDICYQAKQLGIKYIIPITFGQMREKYTIGKLSVNKPQGWNY